MYSFINIRQTTLLCKRSLHCLRLVHLKVFMSIEKLDSAVNEQVEMSLD